MGTLRFSDLIRSVESAGGIVVVEGRKSCSVACNWPGKAAGGRALNREDEVMTEL